MKKNLVLGSLFILPVVIYLFFASGIYNFAKLPVFGTPIQDIDHFASSEIKGIDTATESLTLKDHVTILGYLGDELKTNVGYTANLNLTIYKYFQGYEEFQMVFFVSPGNKLFIEKLKTELTRVTDVKKFRFITASLQQTAQHFESLNISVPLVDNASPFIFVIDKTLHIRSRNNDDGKKLNAFGYDITQAVETGYLKDDIKIVLAEYRSALKKNNNRSAEIEYRPQ